MHTHMDKFLNNGRMVLDTRTGQIGVLGLLGSQLPLAEDLRLVALFVDACCHPYLDELKDRPLDYAAWF